MMRRYLKYFSSFILVPFTRWYLRKERKFSYDGIALIVKPGVFHPGLFYSTKFLLSHLKLSDVTGKELIEVGCGSGLISIWAAKHNAIVTAIDISKVAIENTSINAKHNHVQFPVIQSDLFTAVDQQIFDWIVVNPPYYAKNAKTESEFAWYCGENFEYFESLFQQLPKYSNDSTQILIVLTKGCDLESIISVGNKCGIGFELIREKDVLFDEKDYLFRLKKSNSSPATQV
jgi:release factor glutamine methyltransferase